VYYYLYAKLYKAESKCLQNYNIKTKNTKENKNASLKNCSNIQIIPNYATKTSVKTTETYWKQESDHTIIDWSQAHESWDAQAKVNGRKA
jgi:hypothetical protein